MTHTSIRANNLSYLYGNLAAVALLSLLFLAGCNTISQAQEATDNSLTHITTAERSDGKGYVIRLHLREEVDSFRVYQPSPDHIQFALFDSGVHTENVAVPTHSPVINEAQFSQIPNGIGIDIQLKQKAFFEVDAYPDGQTNDLLMGLTRIDEDIIVQRTQKVGPVEWSSNTLPPRELPEIPEGETTDNIPENGEYDRVKSKMKFDRVVLDPGHGGHDTGAIGYNNVREKDIVLSIAKKVGGYINENLPDVEVIYTRKDDRFIALEERGSIANRHEGDLFVSIHCNAHSSRSPYGAEIYFLGLERTQSALEVMKRENTVVRADSNTERKELSQEELLIYELANSGYLSTSERIAGMLEHQFDERAQRHSRGVKQARFVVLYHASMPAVLVETGFISNPNEAKYLTSEYGQNIIASAIFRAIRDYKKQSEENNNHPLTK